MKRHTEQALQQAIVRFLRASLPSGWIVDSKGSIADGPKMGGIRKSMGALAGMPDVVVLGRRDDQPAVWWLEIKTKTGRVSETQRDVLDRLMDLGFPACVVRSLDDVEQCARNFGWPMRGRIA